MLAAGNADCRNKNTSVDVCAPPLNQLESLLPVPAAALRIQLCGGSPRCAVRETPAPATVQNAVFLAGQAHAQADGGCHGHATFVMAEPVDAQSLEQRTGAPGCTLPSSAAADAELFMLLQQAQALARQLRGRLTMVHAHASAAAATGHGTGDL